MKFENSSKNFLFRDSLKGKKEFFKKGFFAIFPFVPGVITLDLVYGVLAKRAGLSCLQVWLMSAMIHAGSAQFAVLSDWEKISLETAIFITLLVNSRHLLMGASISPYLTEVSHSWKAFLALWMTDESYAVSINHYRQGKNNHFYFLGANVGIYFAWTISGLIGGFLGMTSFNLKTYGFDLVFPLVFLGLLITFLKNWVYIMVALSAVFFSLICWQLSMKKFSVIIASVLASFVGVFLEKIKKYE
jgi:4-azaleucine resistance transporter AzlC